MARIKYVINERRLAYEGAVKLFSEQKAAEKTKARRTRMLEKKKALEQMENTPFVSDAAQQAADSLLHTGRQPPSS